MKSPQKLPGRVEPFDKIVHLYRIMELQKATACLAAEASKLALGQPGKEAGCPERLSKRTGEVIACAHRLGEIYPDFLPKVVSMRTAKWKKELEKRP